MTQSLMLVLIAICCVVGHGLALSHADAWQMLLAAAAIWITVPIAYLTTLLLFG